MTWEDELVENERYLFVTSDDNVSRIIDFIWPVYKEIFGIEKMLRKQCIIYNDAELKTCGYGIRNRLRKNKISFERTMYVE